MVLVEMLIQIIPTAKHFSTQTALVPRRGLPGSFGLLVEGRPNAHPNATGCLAGGWQPHDGLFFVISQNIPGRDQGALVLVIIDIVITVSTGSQRSFQ